MSYTINHIPGMIAALEQARQTLYYGQYICDNLRSQARAGNHWGPRQAREMITTALQGAATLEDWLYYDGQLTFASLDPTSMLRLRKRWINKMIKDLKRFERYASYDRQ